MPQPLDPSDSANPKGATGPTVTTEQTEARTVATKITTTTKEVQGAPTQDATGTAPQIGEAGKGNPTKPETRHALEIALANPIGFLKVVVGLTGSILGLLLLAAFLIAEFLICNDIIIPGVYSVASKTNQVVVPAAAGWIAVNPEVAFKKGTKLKFKVSGRVHLGIHEVVDLAKFRGPLTVIPQKMDPANVDCSQATTYLRSLGEWRHPWRDVRYKGDRDTDACRLSPTQPGGKLVYAVLTNPPTYEQLGVNILDSTNVKAKGILDSDTEMVLEQDGFVILTVNDRIDCDNTFAKKRNDLQAYLRSVSSCELSPGKDLSSRYDLNDELMRSATIADNEGEFFVHLTVD